MLSIVDLVPEIEVIARQSRSEDEYAARFGSWLDDQERGPLGPLLADGARYWSASWRHVPLAELRTLLEGLHRGGFPGRARRIVERFGEVAGGPPDCDVVLLAGLRRPEGYSRFDLGRNTVYIGLDHPNTLAHDDQFEVILSHELLHAVRDPVPAVQAGYGGWPRMTHDDFVERYSFPEHLVSESFATSFSAIAYPGREERRYYYMDEDEDRWCAEHRELIARRIERALAAGEHYHTFYSEEVVAPGSPSGCDYYLGYHLGRFAAERESPERLVRTPAREFLDRFLAPFLAEFARTKPPRSFEGELLDWMTAHPREAVRLQEDLQAAIAEAHVEYAGEPYPVLVFPVALEAPELELVRRASEGLFAAVDRVVDLYRAEPDVRTFFAFPPHLEELVLGETGYRPHVPIARFDSYWDAGELRFLEVNTNGTTGIVLSDTLSQRLAADPVVGSLLERHALGSLAVAPRLLEAIRAAWGEARAARGLPAVPHRIAVLDWAGLATRTELAQLASYFTAEGLDAGVVAPEDLSYDGRTLSAGGRPIDLVYRRLTTTDVLDQPDRLRPFLEACRDARVVSVGSFPADVAHSKRIFAFLTDERWRDRFTPEEREIVSRHVPWTRLLRDEETEYDGRRHSLPALALEARERFVLKPATRHEGAGVLLGVETPAEIWREEVARRLGGDHVIQEYVEPPVRVFHEAVGSRIEEVRRHLHLGEFMIAGRLAGLLARASTERVLSVASNERAVPCYVARR